MSILIRGMEMPKNCYGCCFFHQVDYWNRDNEADILSCCKRTGEKTFDDFIKYLPNCPLVPVPPHGRLIDADELANSITGAIYHSDLRDAPTIIPAEEGE